MFLEDVLMKYYNEKQIEHALALLDKYGLLNDFNQSATRFYCALSENKNTANSDDLQQLLRGYLPKTINELSEKFANNPNNPDYEIILNTVSVLISDAMPATMKEQENFLNILKEVIISGNLDTRTESWIYLFFKTNLKQNITPAPIIPLNYIPFCKENLKLFINWKKLPNIDNSKVSLPLFLHELFNLFPSLDPQKAVKMMFLSTSVIDKFSMLSTDLIDFLCLFRLFKRCDRIGIAKSPGLYGLINAYLLPFADNTLPNRPYRKLVNEALAHPATNILTREKLSEIFHKYCPGPDYAENFQLFFKMGCCNHAG